MPELKIPGDSPQFGTAEYSGAPAGDICKACGQPVTGVYYRANNSAMLCGSCADRVQREVPKDSHAAFIRGLLCGIGGFALGLILYAGFTIATGIEIGFVSLAVGWLVGKAMMLGSGGIGGRRYQVTAVLLTYAAVSMAFIPIMVYYVAKEKSGHKQVQTQPGAKPQGDQGVKDSSSQPDANQNSPAPRTRPSPAALLGQAILLGLASPFLQLQSGISGVIGLVILLVGMQFAWKITRGHPKILIDGPFQISSPTKA
jgi:hypothetical protein